jgi:hypothetical protein
MWKKKDHPCGDGNGTDMFLLDKQVRVVCFLSMENQLSIEIEHSGINYFYVSIFTANGPTR